MALSDHIKVNKRIDINISKDGVLLPIPCEIKGVTSDSVMMVYPSGYKDQAAQLTRGQQVELSLYTLFGVVVLTSKLKEAIRMDCIVVEYPQEKTVIQRREFFRVSVQRPIEVFYNDGYKDHTLSGKTIDISGGGVRFWSLEHVQVGFMADLKLFIGDLCRYDGAVDAKGRILYTKSHDSLFTSKPGYISVIKFYEISPKSRQLIMQTCFAIQIDMRKKGIL